MNVAFAEESVHDARKVIAMAGNILETICGGFVFADAVVVAIDNGYKQLAVESGGKLFAITQRNNVYIVEYQIHSESDNDSFFGDLQ